ARNTTAAVVKLGVLIGATRLPIPADGMTIYFSVFVGTVVSFGAVACLGRFGRLPLHAYRPQWMLLRLLGPTAVEHHVLNLSLQASAFLMPLLVAVLLSPTVNAYFYIAWMLASLVFL